MKCERESVTGSWASGSNLPGAAAVNGGSGVRAAAPTTHPSYRWLLHTMAAAWASGATGFVGLFLPRWCAYSSVDRRPIENQPRSMSRKHKNARLNGHRTL